LDVKRGGGGMLYPDESNRKWMIKKPSTIKTVVGFGELLGLALGYCVQLPERRSTNAVRLPNQNPNESAGSEVRPQPPHCDKNSYIF
jgi:hypothetical protein